MQLTKEVNLQMSKNNNSRVFQVNSCAYKQLSSNTPVFNINQVEYELHVHLDGELCRLLELFQLDEVTQSGLNEIQVLGFVDRDCTCWLSIKTEILNKDVGQHIYKLSFVDKVTNDIVPLYFSYIIQDDNPEKPYLYMDAQGTGTTYCPYLQSKYSQ